MPRILLFSLLISLFTLSHAALQQDSYQIDLEDSALVVRHDGQPIIHLASLDFNYTAPTSIEVASSSSDSLTLSLTYPATVDFYSAPTDTSPRAASLDITKVPGGFRLHATPDWARQTTLRFDYLGDHFFGISEPLQPANQKSPDLTGSSVRMEVASEGETIVENYASAMSSFYISSAGYGAFFDTFARGRYDFDINGANTIHHDTGTLDWYLFFGDDGVEIQKHYFSLIGQPKPSPLWGLGPVAWRDQNESAAEILDDVAKFAELKIPLTSWFVDRPYSDGAHAWSDMNFSAAFAEPEKWIQTVNRDFGLEFMTWTATAMFGNERFPKHLNGAFTYLDLTHPETRAQFIEELTTKQYVHNVKGHKMDRADEMFPLTERWHDESVTLAERRNRYVYEFIKVHHDALSATFADDHVNFARAAIHRSQPYVSSLWGGDPRSNWDGLQSNIANGIRSAFMGFPNWGTDVGGYIGEGYIDEELYIRWLQAGSVNGLFEIKLDGAGGSGPDRMPWRYGETLQSAFRQVCQDRMQFLPYLYSLSHNTSELGAIMQPMAYRHLDDPNTYDLWDQYYFGPSMLVAPMLEPGTSRHVYFPAGTWYTYDRPDEKPFTLAEPQWRQIDVPLDRLPRFIPENSILVTGSVYLGNDRLWSDQEKHLTIHAYAGPIGSSQEFHYTDPQEGNKTKTILLQTTKDGVHLTSDPIALSVTLIIHTPKKTTTQSFPPSTPISQ